MNSMNQHFRSVGVNVKCVNGSMLHHKIMLMVEIPKIDFELISKQMPVLRRIQTLLKKEDALNERTPTV